MSANPALIEILRARGAVWTAAPGLPPASRESAAAPPPTPLGEALPQGWPRGTLVEVLTTGPGFGEVSLFIALAAELTRAGRAVAWVAPEGVPNAPALAAAGVALAHFWWIKTRDRQQAAWAARELLASGAVPLVLVGRELQEQRILRGLALAARTGDSLGVLARPASAHSAPSPAQLRLAFPHSAGGPRKLTILKGRGFAPGTTLTLSG